MQAGAGSAARAVGRIRRPRRRRGGDPPALATIMSRRPKVLTAAATMASMSASCLQGGGRRGGRARAVQQAIQRAVQRGGRQAGGEQAHVTSHGTEAAEGPSSAASLLPLSPCTSEISTRAPSLTNRRAVAAPMLQSKGRRPAGGVGDSKQAQVAGASCFRGEACGLKAEADRQGGQGNGGRQRARAAGGAPASGRRGANCAS